MPVDTTPCGYLRQMDTPFHEYPTTSSDPLTHRSLSRSAFSEDYKDAYVDDTSEKLRRVSVSNASRWHS